MIMRLLFLMLAVPLFAQPPVADTRNTDVPNTDTHFESPSYTSLEKWEARKADLRQQILFSAGLLPMPEKGDLNPQVFHRLERDGYTVESVLLETSPGFYLGGNLYRPAGDGPFPAVLKPHGHWTYGRLENQPLNSTQTLAVNLARLGFIVFAYDMVGYNDTLQTPHRFSDRTKQLWGFGPLGLQLWNSIRALDYVAARPDVDTSRIAVTGASGGGTQTFLLAAVDDRIALSAPVNMVSAIMQGGCVCENAPGLRIGAFNVEFAAMMAPKPMLLVAATGDWTKNVPNEEFPAIQRIYGLYSKTGNVEAVQFDSPHNYHQDSRTAVYRFLAKHLLGRDDASEIDEQDVRIEQPREMLALYGQARPDNMLDFEGVFEAWKKAARAQARAASDAELREGLRLALHAPWPEKVSAEMHGEWIVLSRPSVGDQVLGRWRPGDGAPLLVVHPDGSAPARETEQARKALAAGRPVLLLDAFQTGAAVAPRDRSHQHFLTFNPSDDAARVQDILTALAFLEEEQSGPVEVAASGDAGVWALFAAAISEAPLQLEAELEGFEGRDDEFLERMFVPGIQRAGGLQAALRLTASMRTD